MVRLEKLNRAKEEVVKAAGEKNPVKQIIATHLDSVNHALVIRNKVREYASAHGLSQIMVSGDGELLTI